MKILFWFSLAGILYTYVGYPVWMWLLARLRPRPWRSAPLSPSVSVLLAVHNGAALLESQIDRLLRLDYAGIREVIVVSDGSTDGTAEMLRAMRQPRLETIILPEHGGKAVAINAGLARASGEVILFVDIRPQIAEGAVARLLANFADPKVGCVSGNLKLRQEGHDAAAAAVGGIYWRYEQWIRMCEATVDSPVGVYGGFYAIRRELATPQPAGMILDDMFQPLSVIRQGYRSVVETEAYVYDMWPKKMEGEFHRKVRTLAGNFQLFQLAPWTLTTQNRVLFQLLSHKAMRLVVPYLFVLLLASSVVLSIHSLPFALFAYLQMAAWAIALASLRFELPEMRFAAPLGALLTLNAAAVVGFYRFLFTPGPLWRIWNTQKPVSGAAASGLRS